MSNKTTSLGAVFDATKVAPAAPMEAVPSGWYSVIITDGEVTATEGGDGRRLALEFTIQEGPCKGRKVFDGFNIVHSNVKAAQIAAEQLSAICHATNTFQVSDVSQLFNKPFQIKVDIEGARTVDADGDDKDSAGNAYQPGAPGTKTYEAKNRFKGAKAGSAPVASVATGAPGAAAPAWAAKPAGAAAASPAAPAGGVAPPWAANGAPAGGATPPAAAPGGKPAAKPGKPGGKKPAAAKPERKFFVGIDSPEFGDLIPESKILEYFTKGMPADTGILSEEDSQAGVTEYKTAAAYGIGTAAPAPAPAPAAAAAGNVPPWAK